MKTILQSLLLFLFLGGHAIASDKKPTDKEKPTVSIPSNVSLSAAEMDGLNEAISRLNSSSSIAPIAVDYMDDIPLNLSATTEDHRGQARKLMSFLDNNPDKLTTTLGFESLMTLPVGIKKTLSDNSEVTIGIYSAEFDNNSGADVTIFCRLTTQVETAEGGRERRDILFGVSGVRFTKKGGLMSDSVQAVLLGDFTIPSKNWTIKLNGALSMGVPSSSQTFISFDCNGFKQVSVNADIIFPRNVIVPYDVGSRTGKSGRFTLSTRAVVSSGFRNLLLEAENKNNEAFAVAGFEKFGFKINNLVVDMSDLQNSPSMTFPAGYNHPDAGSTLWRGVSLGELGVYFPKEFDQSGTEISLKNLFIDNTGFTGNATFSSTQGIGFKAQNWDYSIKSFQLEFLQNKLISGGFGGGFYTPINSKDSNSDNTGFAYTAMIYAGGTYQFSITADANDIPIKAWKARGKIYKGSTIDMQISGGKFYPSCNLSGELNIGVKNVSESSPNDEGFSNDADATIKFNGIIFENLSIQTSPDSSGQKIRLSIGGFKYVNSDGTKIARIPIAITRLEKDSGSPTGEIWLGIGFKISLLKDKIAGSSDFVIKSRYANGKLESAGIALKKIYVEGSGTAFSAVGQVNLFEDNKYSFGKGFYGFLNMAMYKPFAFGIEVEALFGRTSDATSGNQSYSYGYFSAYAGSPSSMPGGKIMKLGSEEGKKPVFGDSGGQGAFLIPTGFGDLSINGVGVGIYFNMSPQASNGNVTYTPNYLVPFGIKAMLGIQNTSASFVGNVAVDFSLSRTHGINSIGVYGKGTFAVKNPVPNFDQNGLASVINSNMPSNHSSSGLLNSSTKVLDVKDRDNAEEAKREISVSLAFLLNIPDKIAHLEAVVDVNIGDLKGLGTNGRAGQMVLHFEKNNNYFYLGRSAIPDRIGLKFKNGFEIGAYLMAGKGLDPFPLPPAEVVSFFPSLRNRLNSVDLSNFSNPDSISGFAVGAYVKTNINLGGWLGSIKGNAVGGFDLLVAKGTPCAPTNWLGQMQIYAMAQVKAKVLRLTVFNGGLGVYLYGQGLNPFGAKGDVCLQYGRKKKKLCLSFKVGNKTC